MELDIAPGKPHMYWNYHNSGKWFKQAKDVGNTNNEKENMLFDSGADISIIYTTFARKMGCLIDESRTQDCVGIGENENMTVGRTRVSFTLDGSLAF